MLEVAYIFVAIALIVFIVYLIIAGCMGIHLCTVFIIT